MTPFISGLFPCDVEIVVSGMHSLCAVDYVPFLPLTSHVSNDMTFYAK